MFFIKRAIQDILSNRFLHIVTIITIILSVLIVSAFGLFFINAKDVMESWKKGVRIMVYLKTDYQKSDLPDIEKKIRSIEGVQDAVFIAKDTALKNLQNQLGRQSSLLENLRENPLPDAFEIRIVESIQKWEEIEILAARLESIHAVDEIEYGQKWLGRLTTIFNLFRLGGFAMCIVFFMASVFIVANSIRLLFYSRREEFEIMRLVGATDAFIKIPFYIEGVLQGAIGGITGILLLYIAFALIVSNVEQNLTYTFFDIRFLSFNTSIIIILCSMFAGWLGCFLSFKQFLDR